MAKPLHTVAAAGSQSLLKTPGMLKTLLAVASAFGSWSLLLPVVPLAVIQAGGSETLAGGTTAAFMATTVVTQWFTPQLVRRFGYIAVMVASAFILGGPSFLYAFSVDPLPVLLISAVRGVGFGAICVAQAALIAELVVPALLGKASGTLGFVIGLVQMIMLPVGLYLAEHVGFTFTYVTASVVALAATALCITLPKVAPAPKHDVANAGGLPPVATWKLITIPALAVGTFAMGYGAVSSFVPAAIGQADPARGATIAGIVLAVAAGSQMLCRYAAGLIADRRGMAGVTTFPSLIAGVVGLALMALILGFGISPWWMIVAAALFGGGFGAVQNEALLMMFARLPRSRVTDASALWNMSYDGGTGIGAVALGVVAGSLAYAGMFGVAAGIIAFGLFSVWIDRQLGRHRIAERNNTRARLRQVPAARKAYYGAKAVGRASKKPVHFAGDLARSTKRVAETGVKLVPIGHTSKPGQTGDTADTGTETVEIRNAKKAKAKQQAFRRKDRKLRQQTGSIGQGAATDSTSSGDASRAEQSAARRAAGRSGRAERKFLRRFDHGDNR
ncbi:MFS transporter [Corynebacterium choanae]|uniref:Major Facilitator Superfamily protein n=1 Tax=Corynebacterium choanae TaxID=1862358 RepID=A0A3G6J975_9CORY|nr:MFS transporter [Corynebacterium choanae]AZA13000.1 Major Facilitator Superfamily protein [Corynebacterium choanae]